MIKPLTALALFAAVLNTSGCATQQQQLQARQEGAIQSALQRGRFDLNCPAATATVLSRDYIQPAVQGPWASGMTRVEYTVGVEGCNQRTTYIVICQEGTETCFAEPRRPLENRGPDAVSRVLVAVALGAPRSTTRTTGCRSGAPASSRS